MHSEVIVKAKTTSQPIRIPLKIHNHRTIIRDTWWEEKGMTINKTRQPTIINKDSIKLTIDTIYLELFIIPSKDWALGRKIWKRWTRQEFCKMSDVSRYDNVAPMHFKNMTTNIKIPQEHQRRKMDSRHQGMKMMP